MSIIPTVKRACFHSTGFTLFLAALSVLAAALVLAREITYGVGLHWDSINYIAAARNLLEGGVFSHYDGTPYTWWPPLYPLSLATVGLGIFDPLDVAGPLNAIIFGLTVFVVGLYLQRRLVSRFLVVWACFAVALSEPLVELASTAMSGPLFILLAIIALIQTDKTLTESKAWFSLLWAAIFSALALQTRYIGVAVPVLVCLFLLFHPGASLFQRTKQIAVFSLIVAVPMGLWLLRNYLTIGNLTGNPRVVDYSFLEVLHDIASAFYVHFASTFPRWLLLLLLALIAIASILVGYSCIKSQWKRPFLSVWLPIYVFGGFALVYLASLVAGMMTGNTWHGVQSRFL